MAKLLSFKVSPADNERLKKHIQSRVIGCEEPRCWELKDEDDQGTIYLERHITGDIGRYVPIRRYLWVLTYERPLRHKRKIMMRCGNSRCVNPAHMKVKGFDEPYKVVFDMVADKWLTLEQLQKWYSSNKEPTG